MLNSVGEQLAFGPFELRSASGEILRDGLNLRLPPQPFRVLLMLVSRPGELITREEIQEALWSDGTTVEFDQSLNFCIRQIRAALADDAREPKYIETLPKRGYRFIATVTRTVPNDKGATAVERDPQPEPMAALPLARKRPIAWVALAITAAAALVLSVAHPTTATHASPSAILVRPFVNLGLPAKDAWFSDALTQQLIGSLAETKALHVVPWSSTLALKGESAGVRELGNRFHVGAIVEGSVGRSGERLRVITQLVDVGTERIFWSHQDDRDAHDLASVQDDVMNAIAGTLRLRLTETATPEARRRPQDQETYNLYLKAVVLGDQFSSTGAAESVKDFEEVIRRAPGYAPAYAGLANELAILPFFQQAGVKQILTRSRNAAERAIALDPSLAKAHAALGNSFYNSWDWERSEKELQTALSLDPDSAMTRQLYGQLLGSEGRAEEAIREARRAAELAPTSGLISFSVANILFHAGNFDEAIDECRRTLVLDPGFLETYNILTRAYTMKGMAPDALQTLSDWERHDSEPVQPLWKANLLARSGHREEAVKMINQWLASNPRASRPPLALGAALLAAGEKDRALEAVRLSIKLHVPSMVWVQSTPELAEVSSDPRFATAVSLMKPE